MTETVKTHIAYRCPECTDAIFGFAGKYALRADMVRLKCSCGKSALDIRAKDSSRVEISAPCILCKQNHTYTVSENLLFEREILTLPCPYSNTDIVFIGERERIADELDRTGEELSRLVAGLEAEDIRDLQPEDMNDDEILPDPAVYDTLRFVLKDLEAEGKVSCPCSSGEYDLRFTDTGIQAYCKRCGATYDFNAISPAVAEEYIGLSSLTLK